MRGHGLYLSASMKIFYPCVFLFLPSMVCAQDTLLAIYGTVYDITNEQPVHPAEVIAFDPSDSLHIVSTTVDRDGRYMLGLFEERNYTIRFNAPGFVPKYVEIQMAGPSPAQWESGYGLSVDMTLFREVPELDLTMGHEPVGRGVYEPSADVFEWDRTYTQSIRSRQKELLRSYKQSGPKQ